ncbi:ArnT family glycosyltransferase [Actinoplanes aureus]|uniref:Glycosyltransferase family 39 protein n=1 Tax=Actinoplanes aureus TaxID=2792083 RepID=A0A931CCX8_9ACTN|nr:glycosyltransferase family 39 protein [Actinoplanes aureus]MBG0567789.1 glycosyltransferase family 39 protein [Actinoplanes aureus]
MLAAIGVIAGLLYLWSIARMGMGHPYYSAAVHAMSQSWKAFLFGTTDLADVATLDKPPGAFWIQALTVRVFGYHGWSVLAPQAVETVLAVLLLHRAVRRWAGENAGLLAAAVLAVTPIMVAVARATTADPLLVLVSVAAVYALTRALQQDSTRWLLLSTALVGFGFTTKMLVAWLILPPMLAAYLIAGPASWRRRAQQLAAAAGTLLVASFWWVLVVDLWPGDRPYISGSGDGTARDLVFGYNGFGRLFGGDGGGANATAIVLAGCPGPERLFASQVGGQAGWLLPLCGLLLAAVVVKGVVMWRQGRPARRLTVAGWVVWGGWLLLAAVLLSTAKGLLRPYYTAMLAPAIAAVAGAGSVLLWRWYRSGDPAGWLLPPAVVVTTAWSYVLLERYSSWHPWSRWVVLGLGAGAALALFAVRAAGTASRFPASRGLAAALSVAAMLLGPVVWSAGTTFGPVAPAAAMDPLAGPPALSGIATADPVVTALMIDTRDGKLYPVQEAILDFATANSPSQRIKLAIEGGGVLNTSSYLQHSDQPVVGLGGFLGQDPAPSATELASWVSDGEIRFVAINPAFRSPELAAEARDVTERIAWVSAHCAQVPVASYWAQPPPQDPSSMLLGVPELFDCVAR